MIDNSKNYREIRSEYLAKGLSFLGFRFYKMGFGKDTIYSFEETDEFKKAMVSIMDLRAEVNTEE